MARAALDHPPAQDTPRFRAEFLAALVDLVDGRPDVKQRKMFGHPSFATRGKMFACVMEEGIALKLPPATIEALADPAIVPFRPGGHTMGGWIEIRRGSAQAYRGDRALVEEAIAYVAEQASQVKPATPRSARPRLSRS